MTAKKTPAATMRTALEETVSLCCACEATMALDMANASAPPRPAMSPTGRLPAGQAGACDRRTRRQSLPATVKSRTGSGKPLSVASP